MVIGSGERVQQVILPALHCLRPQLELVGIHSRTQATVESLAQAWAENNPCTASNNLTHFDFEQIDLIIIAITKEANPNILQQLIDLNACHIPILIDTPPLHLSGMRHLKLFHQFSNLFITEDEIAHPFWAMSQDIISQGKIGRLQQIEFYQSAYRYHGFARLRWLADKQKVLSSRAKGKGAELHLRFPNGLKALMTEPFSRDRQDFRIIGSDGLITTVSSDTADTANQTTYRLGVETDTHNRVKGFSINGETVEPNPLDRLFFDKLPYAKFQDHTLWNLLKIRGVIELIHAAAGIGTPHYRYTYQDAHYDYIASTLLRRVPLWFDPLAKFQSSIISLIAGRKL